MKNENETKFKIYQNKLSKLVKISKKKYYNDYFIENSNNVKNTRKGIKQIITLKPQKANLPTKLVMSNSITTDTKSIANALNDFFSNIGKNWPSLYLKYQIYHHWTTFLFLHHLAFIYLSLLQVK